MASIELPGPLDGWRIGGRGEHPKRVAAYKQLIQLAWADGILARKERLLLDAMRDLLGLTVEEAFVLETDAVRQQEEAMNASGDRPGPGSDGGLDLGKDHVFGRSRRGDPKELLHSPPADPI